MKKFLVWSAIAVALLVMHQVEAEVPSCYYSIERNFFNPRFVSQALALHGVSQSAWMEINRVLAENARQVPQLVKARAQKMHPNPFGIPFLPEEAGKLLKQVLFEVFSRTISQFGESVATNSGQVQEMFDYIREQQKRNLVACFGEEDGKGK